MYRHRLVALLIAIVLALPASASAEPLKVAYNQWVGLAPLFIAQDKGFFKDAGVDVQPVEFPGPGASLAPLVADHLDVSMTTADNVILLASQSSAKPVVISVLDASQGGDAVVASNSIEEIAQLEGKSVAVTIGEVNELLLLKALESAGMAPADVRTIDMNPDNAGAAFVAGKVDAAVTWQPWVSRAEKADGHVLFSSKDVPNLLVDVMVITQNTLDDEPERLKAFMTGLSRGVAFMAEHPDAAHEIAGKWLNVPADEVASMLEGVKIYDAQEVPPLLADDGGLHDSLKSIADFMIAQGNVDAAPAIDTLIDPALARAVAP